ncbi:MAG: adenylosuccinate lyase [Acidobacteriaceae bacterium]|nr:adenylosuccinate lyase [Acidobacteriaceae bacterium]MBV9296943.1 adenylosuccinate lyase [Acidobacteriaceae bacterium]MBV9765569.1 adenylosuccinate lyase [Acidobacteriaceae bacterium]
MIARYTRPEMGAIWSDQHKYECWLEVELAAAEALSEHGEIPVEAANALRRHATFTVARVQEIEREVRHDVIAFTTAVAETLQAKGAGEASRWLHYGLTSNDVVDTAQALQIRDASALIAAGLDQFASVLKKLAFEHKHTVQIGRTHGIHAEPVTFGLKLALWWDELERHRKRFASASEEIRVGKISGAVGTFAHLGPEIEERICQRLSLRAAPITSQILSRDLHANYVATLAGIGSTLDKIALEIRLLQRTEVREVEEPFAPGQKGSSAMPHKRNPITCEQICGLARILRANAQAAFEDVALWHERDISHSSVERIILPDSTILTDYLLAKSVWLFAGLRVNTARMWRNIDETKGLIFSGQLLLDLAAAGMLREDAYRLVQAHAMQAWENEDDFHAAVQADPRIQQYLTPEQLDSTFSLERQLKNVDAIFARVFPN